MRLSRFGLAQLVRLSSMMLVLLLAASGGEAQYFGRNKVEWEHFKFKVLKTEHFDIYYYDAEKDVVGDVGRMAERWYQRLSKVFFNHQFGRKPIVLYANSADFQQTTTTGELIGEGTGGFTDSFMNRVVLPLTGDYAENDHVLGHELVHVFQYDIASSLSRGQTPGPNQHRFDLERLPLWLVEGMAEYFSKGRIDPLTAMWMRDATNHDRLPDLRKLTNDPRYFPYRYGQALLAYIGGRFGDDEVVRLFLAAGAGGLEEAFPRALGLSADRVFKDWHEASRELYEPVMLRRPENLGTPVLGKKNNRGMLDISPSISPDGHWIAFFSSRDLFSIDLYLADARTGKVLRRLVSADTDPHFDALRFIDSAGSWSPDSTRLAFVTFERGDNRLAILDVASNRIEHIRIPTIDALTNPVWSPDGTSMAFSGQNSGVTDLFIYDMESKQLRRMTNDKYADLQPAWSPDGRSIAFVSDRDATTSFENLRYNDLRISVLDVASGAIRPLALFDNGKHINPQYSPDGSGLYFVANPEGVPDIYRYSFADATITEMTRVPTGVSGITDIAPAMTVAAHTGQIVFAIYENDGYNIYQLPATTTGPAVAASLGNEAPRAELLPPLHATSPSSFTSYLQRPEEGLIPSTTSFSTSPYNNALHLTYLGPPTFGVGVDRFGYGAGGTISAAFSDVLGRHNVGFTIDGSASSGSGSFADQIGADVYYLNQGQRFNYGAEFNHTPYISAFTSIGQEIINIDGQDVLADVVQQERDIQTNDSLTLLSQYPLSQTRRIEASSGYQRIAFKSVLETQISVGSTIVSDETHNISNPVGLSLVTGSVAFVGDSSIFGFISPVRGTRYRYEAQAYTGDLKFETALLDWRKYFFMRPVTFAVRGLHYGRYGTDAESNQLSPLYVGDPTLVRGYEIGSFNLSECVRQGNSNVCPAFDRLIGSRIAVASAEVRVPLVGTKDYGLINGPSLPIELGGFIDAGAAWTAHETPKVKFERNSTERVPVVSVGVTARVLLAYIPLEFYYAHPFQRPQREWVFGFNIAPGW
jgi:WD40 repeat protein